MDRPGTPPTELRARIEALDADLDTGLAWMSGSVPSIIFAGLSQRLVTRRGPRFVLAIGTGLIGAGILWTARAPVHGHFLANLAGPFVLAGAGTAFAMIPISIAALTGVKPHQTGLASGLMNSSVQLGSALAIAVASSVAASYTQGAVHAGTAGPAALTTGYQHALWVLGAIALLALPVTFALMRGARPPATATTETREGQPVPVPAR